MRKQKNGSLGLWQFIAIACAALPLLGKAHASPAQPETLFSSQHRLTSVINDFVSIETGSTLGFGIEATKALSPQLGFRISFNNRRESKLRSKNGISQHFELEHQSTSFLFDWHPFGGSFRTTVGVLIGSHRLRVRVLPTQVFDLSDHDLGAIRLALELSDSGLSGMEHSVLTKIDLSDNSLGARELLTARAKVQFSSFRPYFGIGWGNAIHEDRRLHYTFDLGVAFHGSPEVDLDLGGIVPEVAQEYMAQDLQAFLASEEKRLEDKLENYEIFPVVSFGLSYRF